MIHTPRVTVVIATHNRASLLPRAVESVLAQTYTDYEVIIVDDCSSDDTQHVIAGFEDPRIRSFRHERNRGQSAARNTGIFNAKGQYIAFLDDDDEYLPVNLEVRVHRMDKAACKVGLVYGWRDEVDDSTGEVRPYVRHTLEGDLFEYLLAYNHVVSTLDIMVRKSIALEVDGFKETISNGEDMLFAAEVAKRSLVAVVPQVIAKVHSGHGYSRMTDSGRSSLSQVYKMYMDAFADELSKRPKAQARILGRLALAELAGRNWGTSLSAAGASLRLDPLGMTSQGVRYCVRLCYRSLLARGVV